jgi:hypothetical protein
MKHKIFSKKFVLGIGCSVASTIVVALLFFVWHSYCNRPYDVSGKWEFRTNTQESTHDEYIGMSVYFDVVLYQNDLGVNGTGEKIAEKVAEGKRYDYERANRVRIEISGNVKNNLINNDQVIIHWVEHGRKRDTSSYFDINVIDEDTMQGSFLSTAADSSGMVYCYRKK